MALMKRTGRLFALVTVLILAVLTGVFLMVWERFKGPRNAGPNETTAATTGTRPTATTQAIASSTRGIDVRETEQGQPVPRNLLE